MVGGGGKTSVLFADLPVSFRSEESKSDLGDSNSSKEDVLKDIGITLMTAFLSSISLILTYSSLIRLQAH